MTLSDVYYWQLENIDGEILDQYDPKTGNPNSWKDLEPKTVVRISFLSLIFPQHDVILDPNKMNHFERRFCRGFLLPGSGNDIKEYIHCCVTENYRFWVFSSNGKSLVSPPDFELYL